ncbi:hypothetical protein KIH74_04655 [Kineosporia sp. J2-2]|uniref:Carboxypeptidase regulatory-like domain-containing protein n=1 Tax=Kineosporia corallincola TaxID=2835133 RepID=A0ABS5TAU9_9ACTN|nr:hypothetical protein [Kineosporia corallincola]MBT0768200.1 hypothetical protein [Kineosporia corallincola]
MIVEVTPATLIHRPGQPTELTVRIENVRDVIAGVAVRVLGADPDWAVIDEPEVSLFPGESRTVAVTLLLPEGFPAGLHQVTVQVRETGVPHECVLCPVSVEVPGHEMLLLTLKPHLVHGGKEARFGLRAENTGNTVISRPLTGQDEEGGLSFAFDPGRVELAPGEEARLSVTVSRRRPLTGMPRPHLFSVYADARTAEERRLGVPLDGLSAQGAFLQNARISRTVLALGCTVTAMVLVIAIGVGAAYAILKKNDVDQEHTDSRLAAVSDPGSHAPRIGAEKCPCWFTGRVEVVGDGFRVTSDSSDRSWTAEKARLMKKLRVSVYPADDPGHPVWAKPPDEQGNWSAELAESGDYLIRFGGADLVPTWYSQVTDAAAARVVTARGGDTETSVNGVTTLPPMLVGVARGSVTVTLNLDDPTGAEVQILAGENTAVPCALVADATSPDGDAVYVARDLPTPGSYIIAVSKKGHTSEAVPIELDNGENRDADTVTLVTDPRKVASDVHNPLCLPNGDGS